ncbi:methylated-DNA--[protein]-cysteine S-methyltransferase [Bizionia argentinensis JUB59]|uniref:Methylated-DNA--protein-cysteine methyltransferase n=1 Tax=Bizionia argentinensis JUB59 TaxID=1046627 RepID=G2EEZ5_9FLAO|nr:methylated-DNA--[protein]-cysteine S-methyltransferase [Bizionia argentinensis]EGV42980.2 methylated-DNA--[protein]-cysteine S-methyltransferase [Bizionia argentinensis JUB59]
MEICIINSPLGYIKIIGDADGISSIIILNTDLPAEAEGEKITDVIPECLQDCAYQLNEYFEGSRKQFDLKLNPEGTAFQKKVWDALSTIPYGKTVSYLELSKTIGDVKAIRAVANANGKNPLWIVIPCHRVIGSDGSLTGYAGGLHRKKWLLDHENPYKQQLLF